ITHSPAIMERFEAAKFDIIGDLAAAQKVSETSVVRTDLPDNDENVQEQCNQQPAPHGATKAEIFHKNIHAIEAYAIKGRQKIARLWHDHNHGIGHHDKNGKQTDHDFIRVQPATMRATAIGKKYV